jgi:hypothetical protein
MGVIRIIRRLTCILAGLAAALVACTAAAPAALAVRVPPPGMGDPGGRVVRPPVHTVIVGGMPGWQIALIAVGAALLAAVLAVLLDRVWAARQHRVVPSA